MEIRKALTTDLPQIMIIIDAARRIMRDTGNATQWTNGYPSPEIIESDIAANAGFVCISESELVGYFCFMMGDNPEPTYNHIESGDWLANGPYGVIHRLATSGKVRGVAGKAFEFAFSKIQNIKVDTHRDNRPMHNFLRKNDFKYCGIIYVNDGSPRDAYQKVQSAE